MPASRAQAPAVEGPDARRRFTITALTTGCLTTAVWLWLQLDLLDGRVFGNFYDIQARAFLDGHLDVPLGSLGNEAFRVGGRDFLYNPPGPSLLRIPVFLVTDRFDGRLTVLSMLLAWLVTLAVFAGLLWRVRRLRRGEAPMSRTESVSYGVLLAAGTLGSTLLYLSAIPWVFHEAYAWSVPMALGTAYGLLGVVERPDLRRVVVTGLFLLGVVLSRATAGFACAAGIVVVAVWFATGRAGSEAKRRWWVVGLAAAVPLVAGMALNWAKFRHPWSLPFSNQLYASRLEGRRELLNATKDMPFSPRTLLATVPAYLRPDGIRFTSIFPYVSLPAEPAEPYGGVVLDNSYRTGSVLAFMPLLCGLAIWGTVDAVRRGLRAALPLAGVALIPLPVLLGPYITPRYTAEFLPWLLAGSALGAVALLPRLERRPTADRRAWLAGLGLLAAFGIAANVAVAVATQAQANPGPVLTAFVDRQDALGRWTGRPLDDRVSASTRLPADADADTVHIIGDCQAWYQGTGERDHPWAEIGTRAVRFDVTPTGGDQAPGEVQVADLSGHHALGLALETDGDGRLRLVAEGSGLTEEGDWVEAAAGEPVRLDVATDDPDHYVATLGDSVIRVPKQFADADFVNLPNVLTPMVPPTQSATAIDLQVEPVETPALGPCRPLLDRHLERVEAGDLEAGG